MKSIRFFVTGGDGTRETVELVADDLPQDENEFDVFLNKLMNSRVQDPGVYNRIAMEYHRLGDHDKFRRTLEFVCASGALTDQQLDENGREEASRIYSNLAAHFLYEAVQPDLKADQKEDLLTTFVSHYKSAGDYNNSDAYLAALGAFYEIQKGKLTEATRKLEMMSTFIERSRQTGFEYIHSVAWGILYYQKGKYSAALEALIKAVKAKPESGAGIRVAIAVCCFKLEQYPRAGAALESALGFDSNNLSALLNMGVFKKLESSRDSVRRVEHRLDALDFFSLAADVDDNCYAARNHMANLDFFACPDGEEGEDFLITNVKNPATRCCKFGTDGQVKAESFYVLARLLHAQDNEKLAKKAYEKALKHDPKMILASFGLGKLYLGEMKYEEALKQFEQVQKVVPDDKDTSAYIILVQSLLNDSVVNFDKLREAAVGFPFEVDLWLLQAQNRIKAGIDFQNALKCYENSLKCGGEGTLEDELRFDVYSNIAILCHGTGRFNEAAEYARRSLDREYPDEEENPVFTHAENDIFFNFSDVVGSAKATATRGEFDLGSSAATLKSGDDILLDNVLLKIDGLSGSMITTKCAIGFEAGENLTLRRKEPRHNFNARTLLLCYNYARILEDQGSSMAAREIYCEILKRHPSFVECYLRLSWMERQIGNFEEAERWLLKALEVNPDEPDANVSLGDLYARRDDWDKAKKMYEKVNKKLGENNHDARTNISLGNMYYRSLGDHKNYDKNLKYSYKFYHAVLTKHGRNAHATNGLGMICAEMKRFDAAREMFSRARESNITAAGDIAMNLAHVHLFQRKNVDAIQLYQSTMKSSITSGNAPSSYGALIECLGLANFRNGQHEEALRVLRRAIHYDPTTAHIWFNHGYVVEEYAAVSLKSQTVQSISEINRLIDMLKLSKRMFNFAANIETGVRLKYDRKKARQHEEKVDGLLEKAGKALEVAQQQTAEEGKQKQKREDMRRKRIEDQGKKEEEELEEKKRIKEEEQRRAREANERLASLKKTWATAPPPKSAGDKKSRKKKEESAPFADDQDGGQLPDELFDSDNEDENDAGNADTTKSHATTMDALDSDDDAPRPPLPSEPAHVSTNKRGADDEDDLFGSDEDEPAPKVARTGTVIEDD